MCQASRLTCPQRLVPSRAYDAGIFLALPLPERVVLGVMAALLLCMVLTSDFGPPVFGFPLLVLAIGAGLIIWKQAGALWDLRETTYCRVRGPVEVTKNASDSEN